jgi:NAD(P)-dependent dehydrogenase (short-subunit alcohol dehydrogenase family)
MDPQLEGQTLLVIGGSSGIGLETARRAAGEGADVILTARDPERVYGVGLEMGASIAAFDALDFDRLARFFEEVPRIDHVLVTGPGPLDARDTGFDLRAARRDLEAHVLLPLQVAYASVGAMGAAGSLLFTGCLDAGARGGGLALASALTAALSAITMHLATELAPVRVNLIAAGFVDIRPPTIHGERLEARREQLRSSLPIGRLLAPADVAALAVHLMVNTAVTGATFDIDGGQRLVER